MTGKLVSTRREEDDEFYFEGTGPARPGDASAAEVTDMGYRTAELPPVDLDEFATMPFIPRMKMLMLHWVDHGFGTPKQTVTFYAWKIFFYGLFGLIFAGAFTAGLEFNDIGGWWDEPILYQKLMIWTILMEILGLAATCGPMAFHFDPPIGGVLYWWQNDTLRVPPYPRYLKFTRGTRRTPWDTGLYKLIVFWLIMMMFLSGDPVDGMPEGSAGMLPQWAVITYCVLILTDGPARQDRVPVGPVRAVRAHAAVLRLVHELRRHDRGGEDLHRRGVDGRRHLEAPARLLVDRVDHGAEHAVDGVQELPPQDGEGLPERHPPVEHSPTCWPTSAARPARS
jgi:hypothetical protein